MAGMDCAEVSPAAWPSLRDGLTGTVTVTDEEAVAAMRELAALGYAIGDCGAAPLAALRALMTEDDGRGAARGGGSRPRRRARAARRDRGGHRPLRLSERRAGLLNGAARLARGQLFTYRQNNCTVDRQAGIGSSASAP